jgi:hypothetical protein
MCLSIAVSFVILINNTSWAWMKELDVTSDTKYPAHLKKAYNSHNIKQQYMHGTDRSKNW